ncbi:MAG TPA: FKBP-type peptidyl-prolyl cis-trans isomerase [Ktedonosporobacter sp.]|nr:FKBP-type peptidyl-prolyl cis-trans isomerase [Ktedonosporobacter sp.]
MTQTENGKSTQEEKHLRPFITQIEGGKSTQDLRRSRPGQRQQDRLQRLARRKRRRQIWTAILATLVVIIAGSAAFWQYQKYSADQATAAQKLSDQHATATAAKQAAFAKATASTIALTPTPKAGPATPPPTSGTPVKLTDGVQYIDIRVGYGATVDNGLQATLQYTGWLQANGKKFDSSYDHGGQALPVTVGAKKTIPGFEEGLVGMKVGGIRRIIIPPDQAYGPQGSPPVIPPNSTLVFDVTITDVQAAPPAGQ